MTTKFVSATYKQEYVIDFLLNNGKQLIFDFGPWLLANQNPMNTQFLNKERFKHFSLDRYGIVTWNGPQGEMDFDYDHLPSLIAQT